MNRRGFIQITATATIPILLGLFPKELLANSKFTISVISNREFGHLIRTSSAKTPTKTLTCETVIVGGGIAGLSASYGLINRSFLLFEGSDRLGGSSASSSWKDTQFAMGAHYDLAYPTNFGKEVLEVLKELNIIYFNPQSQLFEFTASEYIISPAEMEQCFDGDMIRDDILSGAEGLTEFYKILQQFEGEMPLPTRLIKSKYHYLNTLTFESFLNSKMDLKSELKHRIDYQMLDDWGLKSSQVSALAGVHYYTCRPYNSKQVSLISPPNGNAYFAEKLIGKLKNLDALKTNTLVRSVKETANGVETEIIHQDGSISLVKSKYLIYAGQKHALKYILKTEKPIFENSYVPWIVLNIVCKKGVNFSKWQNDVVTGDLKFLGFVNSQKQKSRSKQYDVFTAYYCFESASRSELIEIEENPRIFIQNTIQLIEKTTDTVLAKYVEHVNIKLMGHAMPASKPNYLTFDNTPSYSEKIIFAGVDTGRLPLFFEACDSGLQSAEFIKNQINLNTYDS